jgi:hypothetical protein
MNQFSAVRIVSPVLVALVLSNGAAGATAFNSLAVTGSPVRFDYGSVVTQIRPVIQAGSPNGLPADSPALRVDPNTTTSRFAGVGSVRTHVPSGPVAGSYIGTGTPISPYHILTAAHVVDIDGNGIADIAPGNVNFNLNYGSALSHQITAASISIHPDFTGFANPWINDDLAIITLSTPLPAGVPIYPVVGVAADYWDLVLAGYGMSGDGVNGYSVNPSFSVKRSGMNLLEAIDFDDEAGFDVDSAIEVFAYDFEDSTDEASIVATDLFGIEFSYGNDLETLVGGGDSGGPAFVEDPFGNLYLAGVNTFGGAVVGDPEGRFGEYGGGIWLESYLPWIETVVPEPSTYAAGAFVLLAVGGVWARSRRQA